MPKKENGKHVRVRVDAAGLTASHVSGWDAALDTALRRASRLGRKGVFDVDVQFWATIEVTNPGRIQYYGVTLTER